MKLEEAMKNIPEGKIGVFIEDNGNYSVVNNYDTGWEAIEVAKALEKFSRQIKRTEIFHVMDSSKKFIYSSFPSK